MRFLFTAAVFILAWGVAVPQAPEDKPVESKHIAGPHGLDGWTLNWPLPDDQNQGERYPTTLIIARNGKVIRKIAGDGFVWRWIFWDDGRKVAYESGPLHFSMSCNLYDLASGRILKSVDCWRGIPDNSPLWLETLENSR